VPDLDEDGHPDILVGDGGENSGFGESGGRVWIVPAASRARPRARDWGLRGVCHGGEMSGGEFVYTDCEQLGHQVGRFGRQPTATAWTTSSSAAPGWDTTGGAAPCSCLGASRRDLRRRSRRGTYAAGEGAVALGDTDGDGLGDLALLDWGTLYFQRGPVVGTASVTDLDRVTGLHPLDYEAEYMDGDVAAVGDLDGDGVGDLVVADTYDVAGWIRPGT